MIVHRTTGVLLLVVAALMVVACGDSGSGDVATTTSSVATSEATSPSTTVPAEEGSAITASLEADLATLVDEHDIPSVGAAIVVGDKVVWSAGFGDQPGLDTVYQIGSIEKVFMATAIYQLVEQGRVDLAADIGDYLPFGVRHPDYPDVPITVSMLLTHTSGLSHDLPDSLWFDNDDEFLAFGADHGLWDLDGFPFAAGRPSLGEYLRGWLGPDGNHSAEPGAWSGPPGRWAYSNIALSHLSGYLVEEVTGLSFYEFVEQNIFMPLDMKHSFTDAADVPESAIAIPHTRYEGDNQALLLTGMRASDRIRMSAGDLASFLALHMNDGQMRGIQLLSSEAASAIREPQVTLSGTDFPGLGLRGQGMAWTTWDEGRSGHSGATPGNYGVMMMQETDNGRIGIVILQNVGCSLACEQDWFSAGHAAIRDRLLEEAQIVAGRL